MKMRSIAVLAICAVFAITANAQTDAEKVLQKREEKLSVKKGDPPPGDALTIPLPIARLIVRDLIKKRRLVAYKNGGTYFEANGLVLSKEGVSFDYDYALGQKRTSRSVNILFQKIDYLKIVPWNDDAGAYFYVDSGGFWSGYVMGEPVLAWKDRRDAEQFRRAFNRLIYEAWVGTPVSDDVAAFAASSVAWRASPSSAPQKPSDWDKYRVLAEQAVKENDYIAAARNYEDGVAAYPLWAEGWFNAAVLYDGLKEYEYAANRMRHYLVLMPDAPDAKAAREKIIVWEAKAKQ